MPNLHSQFNDKNQFHFDELKIYSEHTRWTYRVITHCHISAYVDMSLHSESVLHKPDNDWSRVCNKSNTTGATCGAWTANLSVSLEFTPDFSWIRVVQSLVFCVMFCRSLFVLLFFSFGYCVVSYDLRLLITLLYFQTFLVERGNSKY